MGKAISCDNKNTRALASKEGITNLKTIGKTNEQKKYLFKPLMEFPRKCKSWKKKLKSQIRTINHKLYQKSNIEMENLSSQKSKLPVYS